MTPPALRAAAFGQERLEQRHLLPDALSHRLENLLLQFLDHIRKRRHQIGKAKADIA